MKAALALIFFACITGSMAQSIQEQILGGLLQQGQGLVQTIVGSLHGQIQNILQGALGQLSGLLGSIGGRFDLLQQLLESFKPMINQAIGGLQSQLLGGLSGLFGGSRAGFDLGSIFGDFLAQIQGSITGIGQHILNQGLASVLGGLGSLGGSRGLGDFFAGIGQQIGAAVTTAQGALQGALGNLSQIGAGLIDASKPHWSQLQEQLVGHGLNVLGSVSETINNLHGSITGGSGR